MVFSKLILHATITLMNEKSQNVQNEFNFNLRRETAFQKMGR